MGVARGKGKTKPLYAMWLSVEAITSPEQKDVSKCYDEKTLLGSIFGGDPMIIIAIICTILGGLLGASLEPVSFSVSIPIAIMGGFILKAIKDKKD